VIGAASHSVLWRCHVVPADLVRLDATRAPSIGRTRIRQAWRQVSRRRARGATAESVFHRQPL